MFPEEKHYSYGDLARKWTMNYHTVRRRFQNAEGVLHIGTGPNDIVRIPESTASRVYEAWKRGKRKQ